MGVLKVATPDGWRNVGCGGAAGGSGAFTFGLSDIRLYFPNISSLTGPFTLSFELRAEPTNGVDCVFTVDWYDGATTHHVGNVASAPGSSTGPAFSPWTAFSFDVSSYVGGGAGNYVRWQYVSGGATGYVRRMKVTDAAGHVLYGQYPSGLAYTAALYDGIPSVYDALGADGASTAAQYAVATPAAGRLKLQLPDGSWVREKCDGDRNNSDFAAPGWSWLASPPAAPYTGQITISFRGPVSTIQYDWLMEGYGVVGSGASGTYNGGFYTPNNFDYSLTVPVNDGVPAHYIGTCSRIRITSNPGATPYLTWDRSLVDGHPLKVWDGSAWQTVACMVPA